MMDKLRGTLDGLGGAEVEGMTVAKADDFAYEDPIDHSVTEHQGVRIVFEDGARIVLRLSGTGTSGATLRLYVERYVPGPDGLDADPQDALAPVIRTAHALAGIGAHIGRDAPDVVT